MEELTTDVVGRTLGAIVILSMLIERALSPIYEWRPVLEAIKDKNVKEPIAIVVSVAAVVYVDVDALKIIFSRPESSWIGYLLTGLVVAGGSKGSIALFRDYLGWKSTARKEHEASRAKDEGDGKKKSS